MRTPVLNSSSRAPCGRQRDALAALFVGLAAICPAAHARGQALEGLTLIWNAPTCSDHAALEARVLGHLRPDYHASHPIRALARVTQAADRYRLELSLSSSSDHVERFASAASCDALTDLTALLVALALDPAAQALPSPPADAESAPAAATANEPAGSTPGEPNTPTGAQRAAEPSREQVAQPARAAEGARTQAAPQFVRDAGPALGFSLGIAWLLDVGMLPRSLASAISLEAELRLGRLRLAAGGAFWPDASSDAERYPSAQLTGRGAVAALLVGLELARAPLSIVPAFTFERGALRVETRGIRQPDSGLGTWTAAGARVHLGYRLWKGLELGLNLGALVPFSQPSWFVRSAGGDVTVFAASPVAARAALELAQVFD